MQMKMVHGLTAVGFTVDDEPKTLFMDLELARHLIGGVEQTGKTRSIFFAQFRRVGDMLFRDQKHVHRCLRMNVMERENLFRLKHDLAWNFSFCDLTEQTAQFFKFIRLVGRPLRRPS